MQRVTSSAALALQTAIYGVLIASPVMLTVYDNVPPDAAPPYVQIGDDTIADDGSKTNFGEEITLTLHVYSDKGGKSECKQILGQIYDALHEQPLTAPGFNVADVRREFQDTFQDEDGLTMHGVARYRALVEPV